MKLPEFWSFLGATAAFGVVMSFAVKWINQHMQHDIESIGTQLR